MELTFTLKEEYPKSWRYVDPFVGELYLRKVDLPVPPPQHVKVIIQTESEG